MAVEPQRSQSKTKKAPSKSDGVAAVHAEAVETFLARIESSSSDGLDEAEAKRRPEEHGKNKLPAAAKKSDLRRIIEQFTNPLVVTLLVAAGIAIVIGFTANQDIGVLSRFGDAIAILLIVVINAVLGFYQERRAEAA